MQKSTSQYNEEGGVGNSPRLSKNFVWSWRLLGSLLVLYLGGKNGKTGEEFDTKADHIDELRTLIDSNEDNKYCDEHQQKEYIKIILKNRITMVESVAHSFVSKYQTFLVEIGFTYKKCDFLPEKHVKTFQQKQLH